MAGYDDLYSQLVYGGNRQAESDAKLGDTLTLGLGGFEASNERKGAVSHLLGMPSLQLNNSEYGAPEYAGNFNPEMYADPVAAQYQTVTEDPRTRNIQMQALQRLQQYGDQAADSQEALGRHQAVSDANALAAQREAGIRNQMAMRGQGGSAAEFALAQQGAQEAANRAQTGGMNAAMQAALQRLQGTQAAMSGAGAMRGQDFANASYNNDIVNAFNMRNTDALNAARNANTNLRNSAGMRNLDARQGHLGNVAAIRNANIDRDNSNRSAMYNADFGRRSAVGNALMGKANSGQAAANDSRDDAWRMGKDVAGGLYGLFDTKKK